MHSHDDTSPKVEEDPATLVATAILAVFLLLAALVLFGLSRM